MNSGMCVCHRWFWRKIELFKGHQTNKAKGELLRKTQENIVEPEMACVSKKKINLWKRILISHVKNSKHLQQLKCSEHTAKLAKNNINPLPNTFSQDMNCIIETSQMRTEEVCEAEIFENVFKFVFGDNLKQSQGKRTTKDMMADYDLMEHQPTPDFEMNKNKRFDVCLPEEDYDSEFEGRPTEAITKSIRDCAQFAIDTLECEENREEKQVSTPVNSFLPSMQENDLVAKKPEEEPKE